MVCQAMDKVQLEADRLYKQHFGKMVTSLHCTYRGIELETAEDVVHDSFTAALVNWRINGLPQNAAGWIYTVCKHKILNKIRKSSREEALADHHDSASSEIRFEDSVAEDFRLKLLFACTHPDLSPKIQLVITLKYVINLKVESIARILAMTVDGVDKLLLRARQKIKGEKILLDDPGPVDFVARLPGVLKVLYVLFNEGYKSSWGQEIVREELCEEALLMTRSLIDNPLASKDTYALHALMLFNISRFRSRFGDAGEILDLENQDRSVWNTDLITLACDFLLKSLTDALSSYHYEASIACLHCTAESFKATNWVMISKLYAQLLHGNANPFVELNYGIALYHAGEKQCAFKILNGLQQHPFMKQYHLLNTALGKFHWLEGNAALAKEFFFRARDQTNFIKEKDFIRKMLDKIEGA
jgi:RNA polymerase sigma factor (sigma-70 family)